MELKLTGINAIKDGVSVLIVPLWNWNEKAQLKPLIKIFSFNRTFMELKYSYHLQGNAADISFNRTFMELK